MQTLIVMAGLSSSSRGNAGGARFLLCELKGRASSWDVVREPAADDERTADLDLEGGRDASEPLVDILATAGGRPWGLFRERGQGIEE